MGCTNSTKKTDTEVEERKTTGNGFKSLFYATTEFDISTPESDDEDEILSIKSIINNNNNQENLTKKIIEFSSGLTTANVNSSTTSSTLLDNRLNQTPV
jgi:hypothetical protein